MTQPTTKTITLPGHPGQTVSVPRHLGSKRKRAIYSAGQPTELAGVDAHGNPMFVPRFDPTAMAYEAMLQALCHPDATWNLRAEDGKILPRDRTTIEESEEYEDDFIAISPEIFAFCCAQRDMSAEGNDGGSAGTPDGGDKSAPSTAVAPASRSRGTRQSKA